MTQQQPKPPAAWPIYRRLLGHAGRYWPLLVMAMIGMVIEAVAGGAFVYLMGPLTDDGFVNPQPWAAICCRWRSSACS